MKIDGGCHCGRLTYTAEIDPGRITICHCSDCQELSGSAYRANAHVDAAAFRMTGEPALYERPAASGRTRVHAFCPRCGTNIYATGKAEHAAALSLRTGTIRQRMELRPSRQIWCCSALDWTQDLTSIPKFDKSAG